MADINSGVNKGKGIQGQDDKKSSPSSIAKQIEKTQNDVSKIMKK